MGEAFQWGEMLAETYPADKLSGNAGRNLTLLHAFVIRHSWQLSGTDRTRSQFVALEAKGNQTCAIRSPWHLTAIR